MDKYNELHQAILTAQNLAERPSQAIKDFTTSSYTSDLVLYKKESVLFPREVMEIIHEGEFNIGLVEGLSLVWVGARGRVIFWNYTTLLVHEVEMRTEVVAVCAATPKKGVFMGNVLACLLLFSESDVSLLCYCHDPVAYVSIDVSVPLPVQMTCVCETDESRVFLGGVDGNIYELRYGDKAWIGSRGARIICHTTGLLAHLLPFIYAMGKRPAVSQMSATKRGLIVLYADGSIDAFETKQSFKKVRTADLSSLGLGATERLQLIPVPGAGYEAALVRESGARVFLDSCGVIIGKRDLPAGRLARNLRRTPTTPIVDEGFFPIGRHLVILGRRGPENVISVISPNWDGGNCPENCSSMLLGGSGYTLAGRVHNGRLNVPTAETALHGEEIALLGQDKVDVYQLMDGVEYVDRASTSPDAFFSYKQRSGVEHTLLVGLYGICLGMAASAVETLFRKHTALHLKVISECLGVIIYRLWMVPLADVVAGTAPGGASGYLDDLTEALERLKRLKAFVVREAPDVEALRIPNSPATVIDLLSDAIELLSFIEILLETELPHILREAEKNVASVSLISLASLIHPFSMERRAVLEALIEVYLHRKSSIEEVSTALNEKCPSLFAVSETLLLKGKEALERAMMSESLEDRNWYLEKSLGFFQKTSKAHLGYIIEAYDKAKYSKGILRTVTMYFAEMNQQEVNKYLSKLECTVDLLKEALKDERSAFCNAILDSVIERIKEDAASPEVLLDVKSPYLEEYLDRLESTSDNLTLCDLVWKYHLRNGNYKTASLYLFKAAERKVPFILLQQRIEYLALAGTMQQAANGARQEEVVMGRIREFTPALGTSARERLDMAQKQASVMAAVASIYEPGKATRAQEFHIDEVFTRMENELLGYEELFDICVRCGFSLLALVISKAGVIDDEALNKTLWEDALSGDYAQNVALLKGNRDISASARLELLVSILLKKRLAETEAENMGEVLYSLGFPPIAIARVMEGMASSPEYADPHSKRTILKEAVTFCESRSLPEISHRLLAIQSSLGLI
ncbi:nuclear pore complex protein Nup155 [Nematocida homosporus]|uniref:nuclear pore complex protein Nup155 n=1 Tax=Nematocida homosporus TaxID=1912981 RepID=UPI00221ECEA7|nr:nuclear pore complex protein Nup155 [Nematocida homosporus]KAI5185221.1 nuclear pore complex protein Nup155 [Nematocida homosporus]